jgi:hypothetical protein
MSSKTIQRIALTMLVILQILVIRLARAPTPC